MIEICSSRALRCVVELDEEKVKRRGFYRIRQMGVWHYALWMRALESALHIQEALFNPETAKITSLHGSTSRENGIETLKIRTRRCRNVVCL